MDLFVVNRYMGDEAEVTNREDAEKDNLAKLLEKVKERKKKRLLENSAEGQTALGTLNNHTANASTKLPIASSVVDLSSKHIKEQESRTRKEEESSTTALNHEDIVISRKGENLINNSSVSNDLANNVQKKDIKRKRGKTSRSSDEDEEEEDPKIETKAISTGEGFTVLGRDHFGKMPKVKRVLPEWLSNPSVITGKLQNLSTTVDDIPGIKADLIKKLKENNITHFFPIQCLVIPWMLSGIGKPCHFWPSDICVSAPTGSGKTLTYVLPIIEALRSRVVPHIRALVVLPVQDLAIQVCNVFKTYCEATGLNVVLITGKSGMALEQRELIYNNVITGPQSIADIVITTTGRIVDHIRTTPGFSLKHLRFLVIDEADRIMQDVHHDWINTVYRHINSFSNLDGQRLLTVSSLQTQLPPPQKLLFSATLSQDPEQLHALNLFQPKLFTAVVDGLVTEAGDTAREDMIENFAVPCELTEKMCLVSEREKPLLLYHLITVEKYHRILCFVDSVTKAHSLAVLLTHLGEGRFRVAEISGALQRPVREKIFSKFLDGKIDIMISTDSLARGIDIPSVEYVICYNVPKYLTNYIHRVGRTARAGRPGTAITFVKNDQQTQFLKVVKGTAVLNKLSVDKQILHGYSYLLDAAIEKMTEVLLREKDEKIRQKTVQGKGWKSVEERDKLHKRQNAKRVRKEKNKESQI